MKTQLDETKTMKSWEIFSYKYTACTLNQSSLWAHLDASLL